MAFEFDKLSDSNRIMFVLPPTLKCRSGNVVKGYLQGEFRLNMSASYSDTNSNSSLDNVNQILQDATKANTILPHMSKIASSQMKVVSLLQSVASYSSTSPVAFDIPFTFVALESSDNVLDYVYALQSCVLPYKFTNKPATGQGDSPKIPYGMVTAPMEYNMQTENLVSISIGRGWFQTPPFFIVTGVNAVYSRQVVKATGLPLYAKVDVGLRAYRIIDKDEFQGWFKLSDGGSSQGGSRYSGTKKVTNSPNQTQQ